MVDTSEADAQRDCCIDARRQEWETSMVEAVAAVEETGRGRCPSMTTKRRMRQGTSCVVSTLLCEEQSGMVKRWNVKRSIRAVAEATSNARAAQRNQRLSSRAFGETNGTLVESPGRIG
jgi:hypothetical protein